MTRYYDIGLNLFSRPFPDPEKVLRNARDASVTCILTGSDPEENERIHTFTKTHSGVFGTPSFRPNR